MQAFHTGNGYYNGYYHNHNPIVECVNYANKGSPSVAASCRRWFGGAGVCGAAGLVAAGRWLVVVVESISGYHMGFMCLDVLGGSRLRDNLILKILAQFRPLMYATSMAYISPTHGMKTYVCRTCSRPLPIDRFKYREDNRGYSYYELWACGRCQSLRKAERRAMKRKLPRALICPACNTGFSTTHSQKKYCTVKCQQQEEYKRRPKMPGKSYHKVSFGYCVTCGNLFCAHSSDTLNCSPKCSLKHEKKQKREYERRKRVERKEKYPLLHWASLQKLRQWKANNPERVYLKHRAHKNSRLKRILENGTHDFTYEQWLSLIGFWDYTCAYCDERGSRLERDHVIPLAKGGEHTLSNIVPSCPSCNRKKETLDMRSWLNDEQRYEAILTTMGDAERISNVPLQVF